MSRRHNPRKTNTANDPNRLLIASQGCSIRSFYNSTLEATENNEELTAVVSKKNYSSIQPLQSEPKSPIPINHSSPLAGTPVSVVRSVTLCSKLGQPRRWAHGTAGTCRPRGAARSRTLSTCTYAHTCDGGGNVTMCVSKFFNHGFVLTHKLANGSKPVKKRVDLVVAADAAGSFPC
jgi:hypothetical protein